MNIMRYLALLLITFQMACSDGGHRYDDYPDNPTFKAWPMTNFPLSIHVSCSLAPDYFNQTLDAVQEWNDAIGFTALKIEPAEDCIFNTQFSKIEDSLFDSIMGLYKQLNWSFSGIDSNTLAFTGTLYQGARIIHSDIIFNDEKFHYYAFPNAPTIDCGAVPSGKTGCIDFQSVLTHELGHFLGLGHVPRSEDPDSIMNPTLTKDTIKRGLSEGDIIRIRAWYNQPIPEF